MKSEAETILDIVTRSTGITFTGSRRSEVLKLVESAARGAGASGTRDYISLLRSDRIEFQRLIEKLRIGETYFFRHPAQFEMIRKTILQALMSSRPGRVPVRVWSAGCASGEEPYSIAILAAEQGVADRVNIYASDLSRLALDQARTATYGAWSLRGIDEAPRCRWFERTGERLVLDSSIRRAVEFEQLNLAECLPPSFARDGGRFDLILCRNVLVYFDGATIGRIAEMFRSLLTDDGWLITSPTDPRLDDAAGLVALSTPAGLVYRRCEETTTAAVFLTDPREDAPVAPAVAPIIVAEQQISVDCLEEAEKCCAQGDYERAVMLSAPLKKDPAACALHARAVACLDGASAGERDCREATDRHPLSIELHFLRAVFLLDMGDDRKAEAVLNRLLYLDRSLAVVHFLLGTISRGREDIESARRSFLTAQSLCAGLESSAPLALAPEETVGQFAEAVQTSLALLDGESGATA